MRLEFCLLIMYFYINAILIKVWEASNSSREKEN